jgi:phenylalanine-4-hydroxylase
MPENAIINNLPKHLRSFIIDQNYNRYTAQDHAVWRYVMRQNIDYLGKVAHKSYLNGLAKTGISTEHIPGIEEMNASLADIGWAAVTVDGFIPPSAFMEFQKHHVLVIAADIRPYHQIEYTPAPDIIHEAAGHAPIIADPEYAEYLRYFGEIGSKAFSSKMDYEMYEVIRHLSILKADPYTPAGNIEEAERCLERVSSEMGAPSEMALIRNLHWWTVEYGLIGDLKRPKIYGAGLLSSIGESIGALKDKVIKIPYSIEAMEYSFDITKPQPQLFVTPDFKTLTRILDEFANQMGLRTGRIEGVMRAIESGATATAVYSSGLQVSGTFTDVLIHKGQLCYLNTIGPTTLNYNDNMLEGHSKAHHKDGFGSPVGRMKGTLKPSRALTDSDLKDIGIEKGKPAKFKFESGVEVAGTLLKTTRKDGNLLILSFGDCHVKHENKTLFEPTWGIYDMAIGENIKSAYSGPADAEGYGLSYDAPSEKTHQIDYDNTTIALQNLYQDVRKIRDKEYNQDQVRNIWNKLITNHHDDWLLPLELYELAKINSINKGFPEEIISYLEKLENRSPHLQNLISNGLSLAMNK